MKAGSWKLVDQKIVPELLRFADRERLLYAFVCSGAVMYIGKTTQSLERRLYGYRSPGRAQTTNIRNHKRIHDILSKDGSVDIWALVDPGDLRVGTFRVSLAAGLEDDLIARYQPPWNGRGVALNGDPPARSGTKAAVRTGRPSQGLPQDLTGRAAFQDGNVEFQFVLHKTYFNQGFFNVGVEFQQCFGPDGARIDMRLGESRPILRGHINRRANLNGTPRIMGGRELRDWFQDAFRLKQAVTVRVLSPVSIQFLAPEQ